MDVNEDETNEADGDVEEEDDAPVEVADDEAAGDGAEHGRDQGWDGDEAHGAEEFRFVKGADEGEAAYRDHHRAAHALEDSAGYEEVDVGGEAAEERAEGEDADGGGEDAAGSELVGYPAADGDEDGERESVAGEHRLHAEGADVERGGDGRDCRVEDGGVERLHEEGDSD